MTTYNNQLRQIECYICGSLITTTSSHSLCPECREERINERARKRYTVQRYMHTTKPYKLIYDPLPFCDGGYRCGAEFSRIDVITGLSMGIFSPGTVLLVHGKRKIVSDDNKLVVDV